VFYRRHEDRMLRYFLRRGATAELAADLTAEVFAAALVAAERFEPRGPAEAWLYGIARNTLAASRRRGRVEARARAQLGMAPVDLSDDSLDRILALEAEAAASDALDGLSALERAAVQARVALEVVADPAVLDRIQVGEPFGFYVAKLPEGARDMTVEGLDGRGRVLWDARVRDPVGRPRQPIYAAAHSAADRGGLSRLRRHPR
jgi:hypothetical protein